MTGSGRSWPNCELNSPEIHDQGSSLMRSIAEFQLDGMLIAVNDPNQSFGSIVLTGFL